MNGTIDSHPLAKSLPGESTVEVTPHRSEDGLRSTNILIDLSNYRLPNKAIRMAGRKTPAPKKSRRSAALRLLGFTIVLAVTFVSGMTVYTYFQYHSMPGFMQGDLPFNLSSFQIIIGTLGIIGLLGSPIVHGRRRRPKNAVLAQPKMNPMSFSKHEPSHPLMMTPRPSRDNKFVFKKTKNRGRISRNSMGQRLPPSYVTDSDNSN